MTPSAIRAARLSVGLSQSAMADLCCVHLRTVQKWEYAGPDRTMGRHMPESAWQLFQIKLAAIFPPPSTIQE